MKTIDIEKQSEWLRIPEAIKYSKLNKNILYDLIRSKDVVSSLVKRRGSTRGIRLVSRKSLNEYIESQVTATISEK